MADGTTKPIKDLKAGDKVQAADPDTGVIAAEEVTQTHVNDDHNLLDLTITTPAGRKIIHTTDNHPFYDDTTNTWTPAGQLAVGHRLRTTSNKPATIAALTTVTGRADMYNLTIDSIHTYYVVVGSTAVLVHNAGPGCDIGPGGWPVPTMDNCEACAAEIKKLIGGEVVYIRDSLGAPKLGPSVRDPEGKWVEHYAVVKDGRAYDGFTGPTGMPLDTYRAQWQYGDYLSFTPVG